jgi:hypothetical protein
MPRSAKQGRVSERDRRRVLGRAVTQKLRDDLDDLDAAAVHIRTSSFGSHWDVDDSDVEFEAMADSEVQEVLPYSAVEEDQGIAVESDTDVDTPYGRHAARCPG